MPANIEQKIDPITSWDNPLFNAINNFINIIEDKWIQDIFIISSVHIVIDSGCWVGKVEYCEVGELLIQEETN